MIARSRSKSESSGEIRFSETRSVEICEKKNLYPDFPLAVAATESFVNKLVDKLEPMISPTVGELTVFHYIDIPHISLREYVRIHANNFDFSESCYVVSLIYIDRSAISIDQLNVHRLFVASLLLASKYLEDYDCYLHNWRDVADITKAELYLMESALWKALDYNLYVTRKEYDVYYSLINNVIDDVIDNASSDPLS